MKEEGEKKEKTKNKKHKTRRTTFFMSHRGERRREKSETDEPCGFCLELRGGRVKMSRINYWGILNVTVMGKVEFLDI